jgi:hypothetical protein
MDEAIGLAGVGIIFAGLSALVWKIGIASGGGAYIERSRSPKLFAVSASVPVVVSIACFIGAIASLIKG